MPGRIYNLLEPNVYKNNNYQSRDDIDKALYFELTQGKIKDDWEEYLSLAMEKYNNKNMKFVTYYLCKNEGKYYYPSELKEELNLDLDEEQLHKELNILHHYDLIEKIGGEFGGVFD